MHFAKNRKIIIITFISLVSGLINFAFIAFINFMTGNLIDGNYKTVNISYILVFVIILIGFIWTRRLLSMQLIKLTQNIFWQLRVRILRLVLQSNFGKLSKKRNEIHSSLVYDVSALTNVSLSIIDFITSLVIIIACLIYMSILSFKLFIATLIVSLIGVFIYQLGTRKNKQLFIQTRNLEDGFMKYFNSILNGFKEIHIFPLKGRDIFDNKISPIAQTAYKNNKRAYVGFLNNQITGQVLFYSLIGSILLIFSVQLKMKPMTVVNFIFILLYLLGAIEAIMLLLPGLLQASVSWKRIKILETDLMQNFGNNGLTETTTNLAVDFEHLKINELYFKYEASNVGGFEVGPISVNIEKGSIIFIYGGNGSGKTTFVHSLLGLLKPNSGTIRYNSKELAEENYSEYLKLFSVVFNDFYLFDEFYGMRNFDREKAKQYLKLFEIESKVDILENSFSKIDLSAGQRKRLVLIAALLENRPIIVLDEWAADQDPYFRKKFYLEILPLLKSQGFTIVAITHDDHYYHCADKIYKMEFGKMYDESYHIKKN